MMMTMMMMTGLRKITTILSLTVEQLSAGGCSTKCSTLDEVNGNSGFPLTTWLTRYSPGATTIGFISLLAGPVEPYLAGDEPEDGDVVEATG